MKWNVETTVEFLRMAKKLYKKYRSLLDDIENFKNGLSEDPFQGVMLTPGIRKIRMAKTSKGGGKSNGARIITLTYSIDEENGTIALLLIYDHNMADTVDSNLVKETAEKLGFDMNDLQNEGKLM